MLYEDNDYELLYLINENNEQAKEIIYKKYENVVRIKSKKYYPYIKNSGIEFNDLVQEGLIGLSNAINAFKNEKNVTFSTFANKCIDLHLLSYIRKIKNTKNIILNNSISIDNINDYGTPIKDFVRDKKNISPEELLIKEEIQNNISNVIENKFTVLEKKVFNLRTKGYKFKEISEELGISIKSAQHAMKRAKNKLENLK